MVKAVAFGVSGWMEVVEMIEDIGGMKFAEQFIKMFLIALVWIEING